MWDVVAALIPPGVMAGVIIAFVVWLFRSQLANKAEQEERERDEADDTNQ